MLMDGICINAYIYIFESAHFTIQERFLSHCLHLSSLPAVILEKQIRIPRSLSVKAASVLKGFLNKVRRGQTGPCQTKKLSSPSGPGESFYHCFGWPGLSPVTGCHFTPPLMPSHLSTEPHYYRPLTDFHSHHAFSANRLLCCPLHLSSCSRDISSRLSRHRSPQSLTLLSPLHPPRIPRSVWAATLRPASLTSWVIRSFEMSTGTS